MAANVNPAAYVAFISLKKPVIRKSFGSRGSLTDNWDAAGHRFGQHKDQTLLCGSEQNRSEACNSPFGSAICPSQWM